MALFWKAVASQSTKEKEEEEFEEWWSLEFEQITA